MTFRVVTESKEGSVRFVMDWGDGVDTTTDNYASRETAVVAHVWTAAGTVNIRALAILDAAPERASDWSDAKAVNVKPNAAPVVDSIAPPPAAARGVAAQFGFSAHDPDGDSVRLGIDWGDGNCTTTALAASPARFGLTHTYTSVETVTFSVRATDSRGTMSAAVSGQVVVGTAGAVIWYWWSNGDQDALNTSPVVALDGGGECIYAGCEDGRFYAIGGRVQSVGTRWPGHDFTGQACLVTAQNGVQHIIVGSDEGELYALKLSLNKDWQWPNKSNEDSLTYLEWGAPACNGAKIYISHADDSIFYFEDFGDNPYRAAAYAVYATVIDAPAIDASGYVYFGTDSGYLYKMPGDLGTRTWRVHLQGNGEIYGPVLGADGTIYCSGDSGKLFAVNPDSTVKWTVQLNGIAPRPVVGLSAVYIGAQSGYIYSVNPANGQFNWTKQYGTSDFATAPVLVTNGYMYVQNDIDVLYCIEQATGNLVWYCDCPQFLPRERRMRSMQITDYSANPSITANGNVVVVGSDAMYLVAGYPDGTLATSVPWPKWQHDLGNSGKR